LPLAVGDVVPEDARQIASQVLGRLDAAWNAADGRAFAAEFAADADLINLFGGYYHGRPDIGTRMQSIFDTIFKGSRHRERILELSHFISDDALLVVSSAHVDVPAGPMAPELHSRQTFLLRPEDGVWRIAHWHNTLIKQ
jgi:uncharacterized protein (TIGR02246 family)